MNNFQKTVNLKPKRPVREASGIERVYHDDERGKGGEQQIERPKAARINEHWLKRVVMIMAAVAVLAALYFVLTGRDEKQATAGQWYALKLVNGEIYYGQVEDTAADPVIVNNVYYNYDQQQGNKEPSEIGNLRLVKRGQETHGPAGSMDIVRAQILYLEPLKDDSKVLEAILNYEK